MDRNVEFYFDVGSPAAYLAWTQLPGICRAADVQLVFRPMLLGGVFQATGNTSPATVPAKARYVNMDYQRSARRYGVPLVVNSHFPINTLYLMRVITGVQLHDPQRLQELLTAVFKGMWVDDLDLNDPDVTRRTLDAAGFSPGYADELANDARTKAALRAATEEAVARGVFGAPTSFVGEEMFFGQDRLDEIREELAKRPDDGDVRGS